jgi:hypothetical protein
VENPGENDDLLKKILVCIYVCCGSSENQVHSFKNVNFQKVELKS